MGPGKYEIAEQDNPLGASNVTPIFFFFIKNRVSSSIIWQIYFEERIIDVSFETELYFAKGWGCFSPRKESKYLWISNISTVFCISLGTHNC